MADKPDYIFTRDYIDNNRIPAADGHLCVADVATGTGIWLMDLSSRVPATVQLEGLDISFQATPPTEWLPTNVTMRHWNIRDPVPEGLVEKYDIVHIRYLCLVLSDEEVPSVLQNVARLIKPGGYLQWGELDTPSFRIEKTRPDNDASGLLRLYLASS
ncbi:hypothetical protein DL769_001707 [Monosporascus sp. CRB-8-3]|nr:hypothetical protein DL769_001707 [Monosporascus sp. CRB-8-3]